MIDVQLTYSTLADRQVAASDRPANQAIVSVHGTTTTNVNMSYDRNQRLASGSLGIHLTDTALSGSAVRCLAPFPHTRYKVP